MISNDGRAVRLLVRDDECEPAIAVLNDIDRLEVIDRRIGNTTIISGAMEFGSAPPRNPAA